MTNQNLQDFLDGVLLKEENLNKITEVSLEKGLPHLLDEGIHNEDNFQIFTSQKIVADMIKMVGVKEMKNVHTTVLEPTSGDGAFTCAILDLRLKNIKKSDSFLKEALTGLSTIYSVEIDEELVWLQRNNLYSIFLAFLKKHGIFNEELSLLVKKILMINVSWGELITETKDNENFVCNYDYFLRNKKTKKKPAKHKHEFPEGLFSNGEGKCKSLFVNWSFADVINEIAHNSNFDFAKIAKIPGEIIQFQIN
ncbi:class I SAM-dependent methyltransferase [Mycoplasmoides pneumoniae]|uniref:DNA methylase adenine-specific domain-containing protein n=1 Tax=Mycoplasmoides pneumoniae 309 TaxID=1112856 RepID=A0AB33HQH8_MYCPM|nr:class I SAM-dependent methyltransferase [Mycoplasmoides pneumoniae]ALA30953.1 hypothetical protein B434_02145 [Mycoplasmoides pneumoniae 19294]ALA31389.1 hypothetical protein F536_00620 [Mycoplasmoides pneumoniae 39443]ALA36329.1 hypothetical protein F538_00620 [Mycoplasmoides pneumoniae M1139]ALA37041.1 hypothetical protein RF41_00620 [Mycoplasmoides pneumoniae]ALA37740.1 hypothetical protein G667_00615 [Mycoplasmoides pneumoniae M2592]